MACVAHKILPSYNEFVSTLPYYRNMSAQHIEDTDTSDINNNQNDHGDAVHDDQINDNCNNENRATTTNEGNRADRNNEAEEDSTSSNNQQGNNNNGDNTGEDGKNYEKEEDVAEEVDENSDEEENMVNDNVEKSDGKPVVSSLSTVSNTPYDSIEAQSRCNLDSETTASPIESFDVIKTTSSDEFSGMESIEYIRYSDHENWFMNLMPVQPKKTHLSQLANSEVNDPLAAGICLEEGLADDDSWVEELDNEDDFDEESSDSDDIPFMEESRQYNRTDIDLTLHTIFEESGEESYESEDANQQPNTTELEKYFVFDIGGVRSSSQNRSSAGSESSSTVSEDAEPSGTQDGRVPEADADLAPSRLEKYFLSGFMGFDKRDSDGSVGSDSEGRQSPEQRRKKVVRGRGTTRHSSLDNLTEEQPSDSGSRHSSDTDSNEEDNSPEKSEAQLDSIKQPKKRKRSCVEHLENAAEMAEQPEVKHPESTPSKTATDLAPPSTAKEAGEAASAPRRESIKNFLPAAQGLSRRDSFNNWSSDEETNMMMSKMRTFFKTMLAQRTKGASPVAKTQSRPPQLVYFESELTRLMKTVPGLRDDQVKEIVEYLSSEDTWSDSYDSSDYTSSDLEVGSKSAAFRPTPISVDGCKVADVKNDSDLMYQCLMSSFQHIEPSGEGSSAAAGQSPPSINKVMQHIGTRLVALMHEVSEGSVSMPKASGRYTRRQQPSKLPTISTTTEEEDESAEERSPLPRSKSYDPLLEESRQEASDNERFSWRGSFESALMTGSDSRTRLPSMGDNSSASASASALAIAAAKRRSAGDLLFKSANNSRDHLDRVRSCGSIGGGVEDKIWSMRHAKRRSSVPEGGSNSGGDSADREDDSADEEDISAAMQKSATESELGKSTTLPRMLHTLSTSSTNSLPRLSSTPAGTNIYKVNNANQFAVKSARYRPPGYNTRNGAGSYNTLCAPPRRDYGRRRQALAAASSVAVSATAIGTGGDDCSVSSDISERTRLPDNESIKSHPRTSTVSVTRSDSMASVYSGAGEGRYGVVPIRGEVEFGLQFNYKTGDVEVHVKRCCDLSAADAKRNRTDAYVKVYLLPDKSKSGKRKTRVKKHTLNPIFDEVLKYHISLEELKSKTLWLSVWHSDIFGRNDFLGEVVLPLVNKVFDDPSPKVYPLKERSEILDNVSSLKGELIVALKFVPAADSKGNKGGMEAGSLQVLVKEAKNLTAVKSNGTSDPFCKSYLLPNKGRSCKQKTPVLKRTCHPVWNHTFTYNNLTLDLLSERCLELTIWDHDRLASNEFLGSVRLSSGSGFHNERLVDWMDSNNREMALWHKMIDHPNFWVEGSLILRPTLDMRNIKN